MFHKLEFKSEGIIEENDFDENRERYLPRLYQPSFSALNMPDCDAIKHKNMMKMDMRY
jgi:hypothetical protein